MFKIITTKYFDRKLSKLTKKNSLLRIEIIDTIKILSINPHASKLKTHKVEGFFSSRVNGDIRIIWDYSGKEVQVLELLDVGGHSGGNSVY